MDENIKKKQCTDSAPIPKTHRLIFQGYKWHQIKTVFVKILPVLPFHY